MEQANGITVRPKSPVSILGKLFVLESIVDLMKAMSVTKRKTLPIMST